MVAQSPEVFVCGLALWEPETAIGEGAQVGIRYADHLRQRLALRQIPAELVEAVYREAAERFRDTATGYFIAADRRVVAGRERDVIVVYEEEPGGVVLITFHPLRDSEKTHRLSGRRWIPV